MTAPVRTKVILTLVLAVALAARIGAGLWWQSHVPAGARFVFGDSLSYWQLGQTIEQGTAYQCGAVKARVFRTPGYPLILAAVMKLAGPSVPWARATSALFGMLAVGGVYCLGRQMFDATTGLTAAGIAAVYPGAVALGGLVLAEAPFSALMILQLVLWYRSGAATEPARGRWLLFGAGCTAGAATLVRPSWLLLTPLAAVCQMTLACGQRVAVRQTMPWLFAGLLLTMCPWWIRNDWVTGHFVPTTLQVGASLYDGLNPVANGASNSVPVQARQRAVRRRLIRSGTATPKTLEYQVDRALRNEAIRWARRHPGSTLKLAATKFLRTWNVWPNEASLRGWRGRAVIMISYVPVLTLALAGVWKYRHRPWPCLLCLLPAVYFALLHSVFVGSIRYRQPAMLTLAVLAGATVVDVCRRHHSSQSNNMRAEPSPPTQTNQ